jgi:CBS domain-containing protein
MLGGGLIVGRPDTTAAQAQATMGRARVRHLPVIDGRRLAGLWLAREEGPPVLVGPERVHEMAADRDAAEAMQALLGDVEAVLVWDRGVAAGLLTRADLMLVLRAALRRGIGRRRPGPLVARLYGPEGAEVAALILRTVGALDRLEVALLGAGAPQAPLERRLAEVADAELVLVQEPDPPRPRRGPGGELRVLVAPAERVGALAGRGLEFADALVVLASGEGGEQPEAAIKEMGRHAEIPVFVVGDAQDDQGLAAWARWLEAQAMGPGA